MVASEIPLLKGLKGLKVFSKVEDVTKKGSRYQNIKTDVSKSDFEKNLIDSGYNKSVSKDGVTNIFEKGKMKYSTRSNASSTKGPTADVFINNKQTKKIRLEDEK